MENNSIDMHSAVVFMRERPSVDFIRAVSDLLETDADDILTEMGYVHPEMAEAVTLEV